jgi:hypothetical protein
MRTQKEIERDLMALRQEENDLNARTFNETIAPYLRRIVGKTFAYRSNCYSCAKPDERWDVFRRILSAEIHDGCAYLVALECSTDFRGKVQIVLDSHYVFRNNQMPNVFGDGWTPCRVVEFKKAYVKCLREIATPNLICRKLWDDV